MGNVVDVYEEVVTERRVRTVRVCDDVHAGVEAWHGGGLMAELSGWSSARAALEDLAFQGRAFGVDAASTLSLRVSETVTRRWECPDDRTGRSPRRSTVVARRHTHDLARGPMAAHPATIAFSLMRWLGVPDGVDPEPYLACYRDVDVTGMSRAALFAGYGHGAPRWAPASIVEAERAPPAQGREAGRRLHRVRIDGTLDVLVPEGGDPAYLLGGALDLDVGYDWSPIPEGHLGRPTFRAGVDGDGDLSLSLLPSIPA